MKNEIAGFEKTITKLAQIKKPKIAFGLLKFNKEIVESLLSSKKYADIVLVGSEEIKSIKKFEIIASKKPEEKIIELLVNNKVDGIVRGTLDDLTVYERYQKLTNESNTLCPCLIEDPFKRKFFIYPVLNADGWTKANRLNGAKIVAEFCREWKIRPKIAILAARRDNTYQRKRNSNTPLDKILNKTYQDSEWITKQLKDAGYDAKNWTIDMKPAIEDGYNIIIPVNGIIGNQVFKTILLCGGKVLITPRLGLSKHYEDNSRVETDFKFHVKWLSAWINSQK